MTIRPLAGASASLFGNPGHATLLDSAPPRPYPAPPDFRRNPSVMRIRNSLRAAKVRDKNCRVVRRRGRVYVINKKNPRMKCRQG
jgi:large subunit ribosomal protein L36